MHFIRALSGLLVAALLAVPFVTFAANPTTTITPSLNVQDPGALTVTQQTALGVASCGPADSNCYIDTTNSFTTVTTTALTNSAAPANPWSVRRAEIVWQSETHPDGLYPTLEKFTCSHPAPVLRHLWRRA